MLKCRPIEEVVRQNICMVMRCKLVYILGICNGLIVSRKENGNLCIDVKKFGYLLYIS
jgi:hypothetical protein